MRIAEVVVLLVSVVTLGLFPGLAFAQAQLDGFYVMTVEEPPHASALGLIFAKQAGDAFTAVVSILDQKLVEAGEGEGEEAEKGGWALIVGTSDPGTGNGTGTMLESTALIAMGTITIHVGPDGERGSFTTDFGAQGTFFRVFP